VADVDVDVDVDVDAGVDDAVDVVAGDLISTSLLPAAAAADDGVALVVVVEMVDADAGLPVILLLLANGPVPSNA
jgi:hypothetical protein